MDKFQNKYIKYKKKYQTLKRILSNKNPYPMDYISRIKLFKQLNNNIRTKSDCHLENLIIIGKGGSGDIFKKIIFIKNNPVEIALKILPGEPNYINSKNNYNIKQWKEYIILKNISNLVIHQTTQNLPLIYDLTICPDKLIIYNELATGDFIDWLQSPHNSTEWKSLLFQFWSCLYSLQKYLKLTHNDLRMPNILFHKIPNNSNSNFQYQIDNTNYIIPNTGYVFIIWDYGSANMLNYEWNPKISELVQKLELNTDLYFFHDLYKRLRVLALCNLYTTEELLPFFTEKSDLEYMEKIKSEVSERFTKTGRCDEKFKIGLIYRIIEKNKFDQYYNTNKPPLPGYNKIYMPPPDIDKIFQILGTKYNYDYDNIVIKFDINLKNKIPPIPKLIKKFLGEYQAEKQDILTFKI